MKPFTRFLFSLVVSATVLGSVACNRVIDIQPPLDVSNEVALGTVPNLQAALNGAYSLLRSGSLYGGNLTASAEILGDRVIVGGGGFGQLEMARRGMTFFNPEGRSIWQDGYGAINRVNNILAALPAATGGTDADKRRIQGECLAIRAMVHFELVRLFARPWGATNDNSQRGIPLRIEPTRGFANATLRPSTVSQVYTRIISDLNEAITLLPDGQRNGAGITRWAARAFLARVLLQREDYQGAFNAADAVVQSGLFRLMNGVREVFDTPRTDESIFEFISNPPIEDASGGIQGYFREDEGLSPVLSVVPAFANAIRANTADRRGTQLLKKVDDFFFTTKYQTIFMNMPTLRYAEVLLIRAEAAARLGRSADALASLNQVRQRAGLTALTGLTGDALFAAIQTERNTELAFEGHRLHDIRRWRGTVPNPNAPNEPALQWNSDRLVLQIPDIERNATPADFWN